MVSGFRSGEAMVSRYITKKALWGAWQKRKAAFPIRISLKYVCRKKIKVDDEGRFQPPRKRKEDIVRSGDDVRDAHSPEAKDKELVNFCKGCGSLRNVLERLKGSGLYDRGKAEAAVKKARTEDGRPMSEA